MKGDYTIIPIKTAFSHKIPHYHFQIYFLSMLSLPSGSIKLRISIYNKNDNLIGKYESELYSNKAKVGIGGYSSEKNANYSVTYDLFVKALNEIQQQVIEDTPRLLQLFDNMNMTSSKKYSEKSEAENKIQMLKELKQLYDDGILTEKEFNKEKEKILNQ